MPPKKTKKAEVKKPAKKMEVEAPSSEEETLAVLPHKSALKASDEVVGEAGADVDLNSLLSDEESSSEDEDVQAGSSAMAIAKEVSDSRVRGEKEVVATPKSNEVVRESNMGDVFAVNEEIANAVLDSSMTKDECKRVLKLVHKLVVQNATLVAQAERLRGRIEVLEKCGGYNKNAVPSVVSDSVSSVAATKPVETWSLVVRSKDKTASPNEIVTKVVNEVAPSLGVRVHDVKPIRGGGAVLRTPTVQERTKAANCPMFKECGLSVSVNEKLGARIIVKGVPSAICVDEFMSDLYELNLKEKVKPDAFKKSIRLVSKPWSSDSGAEVNVVLEGTSALVDELLSVGRCYIKWFSFHVRAMDAVRSCYRCMGFDHVVAECKQKSDVCRRCGQPGHRAMQCENALHCRNCALRGHPAGHLMMSAACPVYSNMVARANARH